MSDVSCDFCPQGAPRRVRHEIGKQTETQGDVMKEGCSYREIRKEDPSRIAERSMKGYLEEVAFDTDLPRQ